ncbi:hypothetical protein [Ruminococcus sp. XPD3002]|uniref:hypothetical protein n=1 Tax=Ruminococcus sp. XPD3002 TaxID=1452269 RepID=UPI001114FBF5
MIKADKPPIPYVCSAKNGGLLCEYMIISKILIAKAIRSSMFTAIMVDSANVSCIVGDDDEVLGDHVFTEKLLGNSRFRRIEGGKHSGATLPLKEYFTEMLDYYTNTLPLRDDALSIPPDILQD